MSDEPAVRPNFEKGALVPAVVQDARTGEVRMLGYMDAEAYEATLSTGFLHLHSRSRGRLWKKGESSGNLHAVAGVSLDCDADAVLVSVLPQGPTCHRGTDSCFEVVAGQPPAGPGTLARLEATVASRLREKPEGSYTAKLAAAGRARIAQKVGEEAVETVVAVLAQEPGRVVEESADLLYHLLVLWAERGIALSGVMEALETRAGRRR